MNRCNAHASFADTIKDFPVERAGVRPGGSPHSGWELLEHLRLAQDDIVRFSGATAKRRPAGKNPPDDYHELDWPSGYWPSSPAPKDAEEWNGSVAAFRKDLDAFIAYLKDPQNDLHAPFAWGSGQTLLRETLVLADHNSYHIGQLMLVKRMLEAGEES